MTKADELRLQIIGFNKKPWTTDDLPRHTNIQSMLSKLQKAGEIERTGEMKNPPKGSNTRKRVEYRELKIVMGGVRVVEPAKKSPVEAWKEVWKEYFTMPTMTGTVRVNSIWSASVGD